VIAQHVGALRAQPPTIAYPALLLPPLLLLVRKRLERADGTQAAWQLPFLTIVQALPPA